ncbi:hypothetical protein J1N35_029189 [Gossypium stocksii]|uniref:Uncharacterized protein n=1 Tax=Gossypium stocksii TaxID=47602 RepID=A0A9D3UXE7_9ROSI|nr:hypothetical protein J1N35_029189 [Gossypium stocksii]
MDLSIGDFRWPQPPPFWTTLTDVDPSDTNQPTQEGPSTSRGKEMRIVSDENDGSLDEFHDDTFANL